MDDQQQREMTTDDARAFLERLSERLSVSVENLVAFTKKGAKGEMLTSPEQLQEIVKVMQPLSLNRRQRRKLKRKK